MQYRLTQSGQTNEWTLFTMAKRRVSRKTKRRGSRKSQTKFRTALMRLRRLKPHHQCEAMKMANNGFIRQMCTHIKKLRHRQFSGKQVKGLKRHASKLRTLSNPKVSLTKKRQLLSQRGGFLSMLAPMLMSVVGPAIQGIASAIRGR